MNPAASFAVTNSAARKAKLDIKVRSGRVGDRANFEMHRFPLTRKLF